nr:MAG TPA: hypothetical protein [Caudoviricetes sp.]
MSPSRVNGSPVRYQAPRSSCATQCRDLSTAAARSSCFMSRSRRAFLTRLASFMFGSLVLVSMGRMLPGATSPMHVSSR